MRSFRNAKSMAQTLREVLSEKQFALTHSESLEVVAKMFGVGDWNTLAAAIKPEADGDPSIRSPGRTLPALPIKDATPFPGTESPFWIKRPDTIKALEAARTGGRRLVLVTQRETDVQTPGFADVYGIGVTGRVMDISAPAPELVAKAPMLAGSTQVIVQTHERVRVRSFSASDAGYEADVEDLDEGPMDPNPELVRRAFEDFARYAETHEYAATIKPKLRQVKDAGRLADVIAQSLPLAVGDKQSLLEKLDPAERLEAVLVHLRVA